MKTMPTTPDKNELHALRYQGGEQKIGMAAQALSDKDWHASLPKALALTLPEQEGLARLTHRGESAYQFWQEAFRARGIVCPQERVCMMVPTARGEYRLEWHPKALGKQAIAARAYYQGFGERKEVWRAAQGRW